MVLVLVTEEEGRLVEVLEGLLGSAAGVEVGLAAGVFLASEARDAGRGGGGGGGRGRASRRGFGNADGFGCPVGGWLCHAEVVRMERRMNKEKMKESKEENNQTKGKKHTWSNTQSYKNTK